MAGPTEPVVELLGIRKVFGDTIALDGVDLTVRRGEIHGLLGENGAGKTTLVNVLTGLYRADEGTIRIKGETVDVRTPRDAIRHRVGMVHQHFELVQAFSAIENILLGAGSDRDTDRRAGQARQIAELAHHHGFSIDLDRKVADMEIGDQQKVEILRILYAGVDIMILDEPTTHLTPAEVDHLFETIRGLAADGLTVILIAHKLREVLAVVDRVTVLRRGQQAGSVDRADADESVLVSMMMGSEQEVATIATETREVQEEVLLELAGVSAPSDGVSVALRGLDLAVHRGEVVGVAGVAGNGQRELMEVMAGIRPSAAGRTSVRWYDVTTAGAAERIQRGVAVLPGDRMREGVLPASPLYETYTLGRHVLHQGRWRLSALRERTRQVIERYDVRTPSEMVPTATLSGGNIQKILVARALSISEDAHGGVVVAMNPTSGLDVGASAFVHQQLVRTGEMGGAVLLISEDLDELLLLCDRIVVLSEGALTAEQRRGGYDRHELGRYMVAAA